MGQRFSFLQTFLKTSEVQCLQILLFLGLKWVLREYSSNINGIPVTVHAKKACRGSEGKSPLYLYCSWWRAELFEMFRRSEKYFASTGRHSVV
jgi:hypothetical protein